MQQVKWKVSDCPARYNVRWWDCPRCLGNRVFGPINRGHAFFDILDRTRRELFMKKRENTKTSGPNGDLLQAMEDSDFGARWPLLYEHLVDLFWSDGTHRVTSTIVIFAEDGWCKMCLNNRAEASIAFVTARTVTACFDELEQGLREEQIDWRAAGKGKHR